MYSKIQICVFVKRRIADLFLINSFTQVFFKEHYLYSTINAAQVSKAVIGFQKQIQVA